MSFWRRMPQMQLKLRSETSKTTPAAHGSRFHRATGSIGNREWPGRVQKGKKMSGHYGDELVTTQNEVLSFDKVNSVLILKGSVPGYNGIYGRIKVVK